MSSWSERTLCAASGSAILTLNYLRTHCDWEILNDMHLPHTQVNDSWFEGVVSETTICTKVSECSRGEPLGIPYFNVPFTDMDPWMVFRSTPPDEISEVGAIQLPISEQIPQEAEHMSPNPPLLQARVSHE